MSGAAGPGDGPVGHLVEAVGEAICRLLAAEVAVAAAGGLGWTARSQVGRGSWSPGPGLDRG